ncbi:hypothetical protein LTR36_008195 [Oleoguttula mirabilis]|uniref:Uncharacterized protein n=1 Tax=Oleoguttula mirabilis TaxID=1507867 RepID=A0AAV9J873_9PEZI|nr:hypothetical protein LTR36_008195 [Oleoguttula mirabilis]
MSLRRYKSGRSLSTFFNQLFSTNPAGTEGLYWLAIWPTDGSLTNDSFQDILKRLVIPKILKDEDVSMVWCLQNTSPSARGGTRQNAFRLEHGGPCALVARIQDLDMLWTCRALQDLARTRNQTGQQHVFATEAKTYRLVQRHEGTKGSRAKGTCLVAVQIQPADGQEDDVDAWYRQEHLAMIAAAPMVIRSTRYKLRTGIVHGANDSAPLLLAVHECTSAQELLDYAIQHGHIVKETAWSKRIFTTANSVERTVWDITGKHHHAEAKLDGL